VYIHSNLHLISRSRPNYNEGPSKLWDVNPEDADLDTPECLMANLSLASPLDPFVVGYLDEASMPRSSSVIAGSSTSVVGGKFGSTSHVASSSHATSYRQCGELGVVPLEDVEEDDYLSD
jgi:hypothetical protein